MLLIAEIILTIYAWKNGWKWLALLPIGIALFVGIIIGFTIGNSGGSVDSAKGAGLLLDLIAIAVLIGMVVKKKTDGVNSNETVSKTV